MECAGCGCEGEPFLLGLVRSEDESGDGAFEADVRLVLCEGCTEIAADLLPEFPRLLRAEVRGLMDA